MKTYGKVLIDVPADNAIINPTKWKGSPDIGPFAIMVSNGGDLVLLLKQMGMDENNHTRLMMSKVYKDDDRLSNTAVVGPFTGAPYAVILLETLIAWGAKKILFFGWCGAISPGVKIGDIIVPTSAFIDEGTSGHYQENEEFRAQASTYITEEIKTAIKQKGLPFHEGSVWTTDAIYRETREKVGYYQEKNALAVEMELSALFTVGQFRNVEIGAILVVSDELSTFEWRPGFGEESFNRSRSILCKVINSLCCTS